MNRTWNEILDGALCAADTASASVLALRRAHMAFPTAGVPLRNGLRVLGAAFRRLAEAVPWFSTGKKVPGVLEVTEVIPPNKARVFTYDVDHALVQQDINGCKALLLEIVRRA